MNERGLVEVPENAVRDEPIAFGLTGVQLGICATAVIVAAVLNLLPIWEPIRLVLIVVGAGPIALAAALPIRGEPAYRWVVRAVRYMRGKRVWSAVLLDADKPQLSGLDDTGTIGQRTSPSAVVSPPLVRPALLHPNDVAIHPFNDGTAARQGPCARRPTTHSVLVQLKDRSMPAARAELGHMARGWLEPRSVTRGRWYAPTARLIALPLTSPS